MMKSILEFELPEDEDDFKLAVKGGRYYGVLWHVDQELRSMIKYNNIPKEITTMVGLVEYIRGFLLDRMGEYGVSFDEIA